MAFNGRVIDLYVNVPKSRQLDPDSGTFTSQVLELYRQEYVLIRMHLVDDDGADYPLSNNLTFLFGIDFEFESGHQDVVLSTNDDFVADDWNEWNPGNGRICCRANLNTNELATALGDDSQKTMYAVLWATPPSGPAFLVYHLEIRAKNVAVEAAASSPVGAETYVTTGMMSNVIEQFTEGGVKKVRIKNSDGETVAVWSL